MKPLCALSRRFLLGSAVAALTFLAVATSATSAGGLGKYEIVPGESIGIAGLGMTRNTIENKLPNPISRNKDHVRHLYSLTYRYPRSGCPEEPGGRLSIVFHGLSPGAHAVYMVTVEPCLGTRPEHIGVGDGWGVLHDAYPVSCYHANPDGSRDPDIDDNENSECELRKNGGFTYFSFASVDADPTRSIGAIAIATRRVD